MPVDRDALGKLAALIRVTRETRGWTQDELAEASGVSRPTIQRYEHRKTAVPQPDQLRRLFAALNIDVRRIPVVLGYVTAEEMGIPAEEPPPANASVAAIAAILADPQEDAEYKAYLVEMLQLALRRPRDHRSVNDASGAA